MQNKSLGKNLIVYMIKTVVVLLFPLITFPYITRILSVDSIGKVNFSTSIISYFSLIASLGISTFAIRSGAKFRDDREKMSLFASEIFSINILTTIIAYIAFFVAFANSAKWHHYTVIMMILSIQIPLTTIGVEWLFAIYEEYTYMTVRTIIVQFVSLIFLFVFVRDKGDVYWYTVYLVLSAVGTNVLNFVRSFKYVKFRFILTSEMISYIKPILILFASTVATQIYLNSDITVLGYLCSDWDVGLYHSAVKIYNIITSVLTSLGYVSLARLGYFLEHDKKQYDLLFTKMFNIIVYLSIPCAFGLWLVSSDMMVLFAGSQYIAAGPLLQVLTIAIPLSVLVSYVASGCLVIYGKENCILFATVVGALFNIIFNIILIPKFGTVAAAWTTVGSELITLSIHLINIRKIYKIHGVLKSMVKVFAACIVMAVVCRLVMMQISGMLPRLAAVVAVGVVTYLLCTILFKHEITSEGISVMKQKLNRI